MEGNWERNSPISIPKTSHGQGCIMSLTFDDMRGVLLSSKHSGGKYLKRINSSNSEDVHYGAEGQGNSLKHHKTCIPSVYGSEATKKFPLKGTDTRNGCSKIIYHPFAQTSKN